MDQKLEGNGKPTVNKKEDTSVPDTESVREDENIIKIEALIRRMSDGRIRVEVAHPLRKDGQRIRFWTHVMYVIQLLSQRRGNDLQVGDTVLLHIPKRVFDQAITAK